MVAFFSILTIIMGFFTDLTFRLGFFPLITIVGGLIILIGSFFRKRTINIITTSVVFVAYILSHGYIFIDEIASHISLSDTRHLFLCLVFILPAVFLLGALLFAVKGKKNKGKKSKKIKNEDNFCPNCGTKAEKDTQFCGSCGTSFAKTGEQIIK